MEDHYKLKTVYPDLHKKIYKQVFKQKVPYTPIKQYKPNPFPIRKLPLTHREVKPYEIKKFKVNIDLFKPRDLEPTHYIDFEDEVLKPVFGVERKEIPDDYNVSHYQFRLQGKKPVDIMMDNAQTSATEHGLLLANEKVGESIPTIMGAVNHFENTATTKAEFMKILSQKYKNPRVLAEHVESSMAKSDAILPIKIRAKSIKLQPVANRKVADAPILPKATKVSPPPELSILARFFLSPYDTTHKGQVPLC
jgi:hypothetical protein